MPSDCWSDERQARSLTQQYERATHYKQQFHHILVATDAQENVDYDETMLQVTMNTPTAVAGQLTGRFPQSDPKYKSLKSTTAGAMRTAVKQYRCCNCNTPRQLQHDHQHQWTTILDQTEVEYVTGCRNSGQHDNCSVHPSMAHLAQTD